MLEEYYENYNTESCIADIIYQEASYEVGRDYEGTLNGLDYMSNAFGENFEVNGDSHAHN